MRKDKEWLIKRVENYIPLNDKTVAHVVDNILDIIDQLDEPEVLSQEWIRNNQERKGVHFFVNVTKLQNLIVPKQELPVIPKFIANFIEARKHVFANTLQHVFYRAMENRESEMFEEEHNWVRHNSETFARAWLDGYEVEEEPLYHALIKGHELVVDQGDWSTKYWKSDTSNGRVFPSHRLINHGDFLIEMSKEDWEKLGINESNADFVKVEELEELKQPRTVTDLNAEFVEV